MGLYARCSVAKDRLASGELSGLFVNDPDGLYLHAWLEGAVVALWVRASDICSDWPTAGSARMETDPLVERVLQLERQISEHRCALPTGIQEALNSGDGSYRP